MNMNITKTVSRHDLRLDIIWGGSNFCGHLDPRFAPDWVLNNHKFHLKDYFGNCLVVNGFDMGYCHAPDSSNREILAKEKRILAKMLEYLHQKPTVYQEAYYRYKAMNNDRNAYITGTAKGGEQK